MRCHRLRKFALVGALLLSAIGNMTCALRATSGTPVSSVASVMPGPIGRSDEVAPPLSLEKRSDPEPVKIGFVTSLSGVAARGGADMANGVRLFFEEKNYTMGGRKVELIIEDDQSDPATGVMKVRKLAEQDHCQILDGLILSHIGYAVAPVVDKLEVPTIFAMVAADDVTQRQSHPWVVRTGHTSSQITQPFGEYVAKNLGYRRVACVAVDFPFGWESVGGFQRSFEEAGGKVIQKLWIPLGLRKFDNFISQIDKSADAVFFLTTHTPAYKIPKEYQDSGLKLPVLAGYTGYDEVVLRQLGEEAVGTINAGIYSWSLPSQENLRFVEAYKKRYGEYPSSYSAAGYTSGMWIGRALCSLRGQSIDKNKLLSAIKHVTLDKSPRGPLRLDDHGNVIQNIYVFKVENTDGRLQNKPIHIFPSVSQFWHWDADQFLRRPAYSKEYPPCIR